MSNVSDYHGWPHLCLSAYDSPRQLLNDGDRVYRFLKELPEKIGMHMLGLPIVYRIGEQDHVDPGVTGIVVIATSHIAYHSFAQGLKNGKKKPRGIQRKIFRPFFTLDVFSCAEFDPDIVLKEVKRVFKPRFIETALIYRLREEEEMIEVEDF